LYVITLNSAAFTRTAIPATAKHTTALSAFVRAIA
jgi:hypothetical protein